jgi:hypothetical protein
VSNQNAGYTVQTPAVAFAANRGSIMSNVRFYTQRGELDRWQQLKLTRACEDIADVVKSLQTEIAAAQYEAWGDGP